MAKHLALFNGTDTDGLLGLWVTNGTPAGTSELTGISGASTGGLNPADLTVFNGEALFNGADAADNFGLWVTNGTPAGTFELTGISGASTGGLDPADLTV
jgi:ELWxxDGT repeat protein